MYKTTLRAAPRRIATSRSLVNSSRRFINTAPPAQKSRSWKSSFTRWGLAGLGVYWYNTSPVFAGEDADTLLLGQSAEGAVESVNSSIHNIQESNQPTLDAIVAEKRAREAQLAEANKKSDSQFDQVAAAEQTEVEGEGEGGLEGLEDEAGQQGAFNPETGEINWDCPCLGGMAHGPCGEEFKAAFSCFVYSTEEPKGVECIEKFKGMQDCFRLHPEMYGSELADDEDEVEEEIRIQQAEREQAQQSDAQSATEVGSKESDSSAKSAPLKATESSEGKALSANSKTENDSPKEPVKVEKKTQPAEAESDNLVPKAAFDASPK